MAEHLAAWDINPNSDVSDPVETKAERDATTFSRHMARLWSQGYADPETSEAQLEVLDEYVQLLVGRLAKRGRTTLQQSIAAKALYQIGDEVPLRPTWREYKDAMYQEMDCRGAELEAILAEASSPMPEESTPEGEEQ